MRAISLWQPFASLWCTGRHKIHETRHWSTTHRGWLAVHAAKKIISDCGEELDDICIDAFGPMWRTELPRGAIIGAVHIADCVPTQSLFRCAAANDVDKACGDFTEGRFGWRADQFKTLPTSIPYRGLQSMFSVPDEFMSSIVKEAA